jgi:hypothetical protein
VKHVVFHAQKSGRRRVVVSTEENAISSLDLRTGDICQYITLITSTYELVIVGF